MHYYEVAPTKIIRSEATVFTYAHADELAAGSIVKIPVGSREITGIIMRRVPEPAFTTKQISLVYDTPPLPNQLLTLATWMSDYYATHIALCLNLLVPRGIDKKRRTPKASQGPSHQKRTQILLNTDQQAAVETITHGEGSYLLEGITGSGKTNVYIACADTAIKAGTSVIVLVPEIALTSQTVQAFMAHFDHVTLLHSEMTEAARHLAWQQILTNTQPQVIIGPRSALFAPLHAIGLIVVDEAHEGSYKQDQSPKYAAQRVAGQLGRLHGARTIFGSATPLVSEHYLAAQSPDRVIRLDRKARDKTTIPTTVLVDMTKKESRSKHPFLSDALLSRIEQTLAGKEQVLIYHNRRGSAATTLCDTCGWSALCPHCGVPMTLHADAHRLRCHICGTKDNVPKNCPVCAGVDIIFKGFGTKRVEEDIKRLFPKARVARFDADTAKDATLHSLYDELKDGSIDIIIGTQIVAKGLDLPNLGLVGVLQADSGLSLPDYGASERTFQLLAQVVGRVGRDHRETHVVVQTYQPGTPSVRFGITQDYRAMYDALISEREQRNFPPFVNILKLETTHKTERGAIAAAQQRAKAIRADHPEVQVLGPTPSLYERRGGTYRWQLIVKSKTRAPLVAIAKTIPGANWQFDLDPASLL